MSSLSINKNAKEPGYPSTREPGYPGYPVPRVLQMEPGRYRYRQFRVPASGHPGPTNPGAISIPLVAGTDLVCVYGVLCEGW